MSARLTEYRLTRGGEDACAVMEFLVAQLASNAA
jgi:hypothetical protein